MLCALFAVTTICTAQDNANEKKATREAKRAEAVKMATERMKKELSLSDEQAAKLEELNKEFMPKMRMGHPGMKHHKGSRPDGVRHKKECPNANDECKKCEKCCKEDAKCPKAKDGKKAKKFDKGKKFEKPTKEQMDKHMKEMQETRKAYNEKLNEILTPEQQEKLKSMRKERKEKNPKNKK